MYAKNSLFLDYLAIAINPRRQDFYEYFLGFAALNQKIKENYSFVKGAPAAGMILNLNQYFENQAQVKNLAFKKLKEYIILEESEQIQIPKHRFYKIDDNQLSSETFDYLFRKSSNVFSEISNTQSLKLLTQMKENINFVNIENQQFDLTKRVSRVPTYLELVRR